MKKRKIILVYDAIYPYIKGGGERRFYELGKRLVNNQTEVHLYGMKLWDGPKIIKRDGLILHGIAKARPLYTKSGRRSIRQAMLFGLNVWKIVGVNFDVIDCCGFPYFSLFPCKLAAVLRGKPLYATWHEVWGKEYWLEYLGVFGLIGFMVEKVASRLPDEILTVIQSVETKLRNELGVKQPIHVISNGIDHDNLQAIMPSNNQSDVIYVGRLVKFKHVDFAIRAIAELKKQGVALKFNIIGDGPEYHSLQSLTRKLHVLRNVRFLGFIENSKGVYKLMKASKVLVLPSSREGFGMVVIEANGCDLPVITIDEPHNLAQYLIRPLSNGSVVKLNELAVAEAIKYWVNQAPAKYHKNVSQFDWGKITEQVARVYAV